MIIDQVTEPLKTQISSLAPNSAPSDSSHMPDLSPAQENSQSGKANRGPRTTLWQDILQLLFKLIGIGAVFLVTFTFLYGVFQYHDLAMEPAVKDGDLVLFYRLDKQYTAGETVVVEYSGKKQVRRVVAVAGDMVDITQSGLMINGSYQTESGITGETHRYEDGIDFPITVGEGQVFVLGDNRGDATDSRVYGPVDISDTLGRVMTILRRKEI